MIFFILLVYCTCSINVCSESYFSFKGTAMCTYEKDFKFSEKSNVAEEQLRGKVKKTYLALYHRLKNGIEHWTKPKL